MKKQTPPAPAPPAQRTKRAYNRKPVPTKTPENLSWIENLKEWTPANINVKFLDSPIVTSPAQSPLGNPSKTIGFGIQKPVIVQLKDYSGLVRLRATCVDDDLPVIQFRDGTSIVGRFAADKVQSWWVDAS